jgi:hypothetical protein
MSAPSLTHLRQRLKKRRAAARPALPNIETALNRPFARLLSQKKSIPTLFCELVNKLGKWFSISKAILAVYDDRTGTLKLTSWWDQHCFKEGVLMSLPTENSLFYQALQSDRIFHEQVNGHFPGNYVEQHLMTSRTTAALAVCPLQCKGVGQGVISLSSSVPYAFEMLEEGYFSGVFENVASVLTAQSLDEVWEPLFAATRQSADPTGPSRQPVSLDDWLEDEKMITVAEHELV